MNNNANLYLFIGWKSLHDNKEDVISLCVNSFEDYGVINLHTVRNLALTEVYLPFIFKTTLCNDGYYNIQKRKEYLVHFFVFEHPCEFDVLKIGCLP
jgi:hypothetical protein